MSQPLSDHEVGNLLIDAQLKLRELKNDIPAARALPRMVGEMIERSYDLLKNYKVLLALASGVLDELERAVEEFPVYTTQLHEVINLLMQALAAWVTRLDWASATDVPTEIRQRVDTWRKHGRLPGANASSARERVADSLNCG